MKARPCLTPPRRHSRSLALLLLAGATPGAMHQAAAESSPWYVGVQQQVEHHNNLLRLNDNQAAVDGTRRSDTVSTTSLLAGLDQPISRQRVYGTLALRANRYAFNDRFDNESWTLSGGIDWATVNRLSGTLSASTSRAPSSFNLQEIGTLTAKNMEDTTTWDASVRLGVVTQFSLFANAGWREVDNTLDLPAVQSRNFRQGTGSVGLNWSPRQGSLFGIALRSTEGRYPQFQLTPAGYQADRFKRQDLDLTAQLRPSGQSTLTLRLSTGKTEYDLATQRNFSGLTGTFNWDWQITGKTRLSTSLSRETGQDSFATQFLGQATTADYSRINNSLRLAATYAATAKVAVDAAVAYTDRDLARSLPTVLGSLDASGRERSTAVQVGARWAPTRTLQFGCNVASDRVRGSGTLGASTRGDRVGCYGQLVLQ